MSADHVATPTPPKSRVLRLSPASRSPVRQRHVLLEGGGVALNKRLVLNPYVRPNRLLHFDDALLTSPALHPLRDGNARPEGGSPADGFDGRRINPDFSGHASPDAVQQYSRFGKLPHIAPQFRRMSPSLPDNLYDGPRLDKYRVSANGCTPHKKGYLPRRQRRGAALEPIAHPAGKVPSLKLGGGDGAVAGGSAGKENASPRTNDVLECASEFAVALAFPEHRYRSLSPIRRDAPCGSPVKRSSTGRSKLARRLLSPSSPVTPYCTWYHVHMRTRDGIHLGGKRQDWGGRVDMGWGGVIFEMSYEFLL